MATEVKAHITGTVWKIEVVAGSKVSEGETLIILESMKMEMPIEAPCAGTVREVRVKENEPVDEGKVVVVLDEG